MLPAQRESVRFGAAGTRAWAGALLWAVQSVAIAVAIPDVPPLFQASIATTGALLLLWLWTRWRHIPVFAQDRTLVPGARLGLLFSLRLGLLYVAIARLGALSALVVCFSALGLMQALTPGRAAQRTRAALCVGALALLLVPPGALRDGPGALLAVAAAAAWLWQQRAVADPDLSHCGGEKIVFYQLIGAAMVLPVASVVAGENWLIAPGGAARMAVLVQVASASLAWPLLWFKPRAPQPAHALPVLALLAPGLTLGLQALLAQRAAPGLVAAVVVLTAAWLPTRRLGVLSVDGG